MSKLTNNTTSLEQILEDLKTKATPSGGTNTSDATAVAADILAGKTAYVKDGKVTGTIETKTSSNLTASGATVTVPKGYYASNATKSISTGKASTPATTITATPTISINSTGKITASASASKSITPTITAGYVSNGTAGTVTVSGSNTKQLTTKAAMTYTPTTSNQTIAASTYLTGVQTIKGDSNLVASNIKSGISIFGVTGTYEGSSSEDLTSEVNTYTTKINELETAITALENELQGKASGGSGSLETCTVTYKPFSPTPPGDRQIKYTDSTGKLNTTKYNPMQNIEIVCQKNTLIYFEGIVVKPTITAEDGSPWFNFFAGNLVIAVTSNTIVRNG